ncbi:hypothetical protein DB88DRAFT_450915 [Papiliotrema laurentii]|uniref:Uncharacterized protein n=1 Tax=Papiliotrema laurentii TaxID=5418 RepID=A0AAD9FSJ3_PAPLA|nr:hypothetical protein DB88DRAFT_450915 [Papiliotrema laurentii]
MPHSGSVIHKTAVAVITGAASGIGLACAHRYAKEGMSLFLVDISQSALEKAEQELKAVNGVGEVHSMLVDVGDVKQVLALRDRVLDVFGEIHVLQNNAGTSRPTPAYSLDKSIEELQADWDYVMNTNFRGIMNVAQAFAPHMVRQENSSVIINTGSKQGITCPPGNAGYNVSKAAVKVFTEQLAHELRSAAEGNCTAHLFVPGWVHTGLTGAGSGKPKPSGAWTPEQTVEYMVDKVFSEGDFYVICPDNETTTPMDKARIMWSLGDIIENRPALSRWHPEYKAKFEDFVSQRLGLDGRSRSRGRPADRVPNIPTPFQ